MSSSALSPREAKKRLVFHFVWMIVVARLVAGFVFPDLHGFVLAEWLDLESWLIPLITSVALVFGYWRYYKKGQWPFD